MTEDPGNSRQEGNPLQERILRADARILWFQSVSWFFLAMLMTSLVWFINPAGGMPGLMQLPLALLVGKYGRYLPVIACLVLVSVLFGTGAYIFLEIGDTSYHIAVWVAFVVNAIYLGIHVGVVMRERWGALLFALFMLIFPVSPPLLALGLYGWDALVVELPNVLSCGGIVLLVPFVCFKGIVSAFRWPTLCKDVQIADAFA